MSRLGLNGLLNRYTESNVQLRRDRKAEALACWEPVVDAIIEIVKTDARFASLRSIRTGSYYERAKVKEPDEFDLMLDMDSFSVVYGSARYRGDHMTVPPLGFTRVSLNIGGDEEVKWRRDSCVDAQGMLNASNVKAVFARLVKDAIKALEIEGCVDVKSRGPAVTLLINNRNNGAVYSVDLTLAIRKSDWPTVADEWRRRPRHGWPNQQLVQKICNDGCHLVAKQPKRGTVSDDERKFFWRISFSAAEKKLFLQAGHGEASSCRKQVLRILKALKEELKWHPLTSYHLKTMLFYECEANPHPSHWSFDRLGERFIGILKRLKNCLRQSKCPHYFIKDLNLFEFFPHERCSELARKVEKCITVFYYGVCE